MTIIRGRPPHAYETIRLCYLCHMPAAAEYRCLQYAAWSRGPRRENHTTSRSAQTLLFGDVQPLRALHDLVALPDTK